MFSGYGVAAFAPNHYDPAEGQYLAGHTIIKSHSRAYRLYDEIFREVQNGSVGITMNSNWEDPFEPLHPDHVDAMVTSLQCFDLQIDFVCYHSNEAWLSTWVGGHIRFF